MKLLEILDKLDLIEITPGNTDAKVTGCYVGDLLSWVMAKAQEGQIWLTIMGNANVVAVARLTDVSAVIVCEDAPIDKAAIEHAENHKIGVYKTSLTSYEMAIEIAKLLDH